MVLNDAQGEEGSMRQTSILKWLAPLAFSTVLLLPQAHAQSIYGGWTGLETVQAEYFVNGQIVGYSTTYTYPATLGVSYENYNLAISIDNDSLSSSNNSVTFGPTSGTGSLEVYIGYYGFDLGGFFATYAGILPDGQIDTSGGNAVADLSLINLNYNGTGEIDQVSFNSAGSLPEPSAIVLAAPALAVVLALALRRQRIR